jgi:hypothetical protein
MVASWFWGIDSWLALLVQRIGDAINCWNLETSFEFGVTIWLGTSVRFPLRHSAAIADFFYVDSRRFCPKKKHRRKWAGALQCNANRLFHFKNSVANNLDSSAAVQLILLIASSTKRNLNHTDPKQSRTRHHTQNQSWPLKQPVEGSISTVKKMKFRS